MSMTDLDKLCHNCARIFQGYCDGAEPDELKRGCEFYRKMTNKERVAHWSEEKLAKFIESTESCPSCEIREWCYGIDPDGKLPCWECIKMWLELEAGNDQR